MIWIRHYTGAIPFDNVLQALGVLTWAERLGQSKSFDGPYLAAAEALGAEFWTVRSLRKKRAAAPSMFSPWAI